MTILDDEVSPGHFDALMDWFDAVSSILSQRGQVPVLIVEAADLPGALIAGVRPDRDGIAAAVKLIGWAKPQIALVVPPDENEASFGLYLDGDQRVVIMCGPALPPGPPESRYRGLDPSELARIEQRLESVAAALVAGDSAWHPYTAVDSPELLLHAYFTEYDTSDDRATVQDVIASPRVRRALRDLHEDRISQHQRVWSHSAEQIALEMLAGEDGATLRMATKPSRLEIVERHLRKLDPTCASRTAAEPIVNAIRRTAGRSGSGAERFTRVVLKPPAEWE